MTAHIAANLAAVRSEIARAAAAAGRDSGEVRLIAVSKFFPAEAVSAARNAGQRLFGESKAQELEQKAAALPDDLEWHFIGHLQRNKAAMVLRRAAWIHSVDSPKLLERLDRLAGELGRRPNILLEVNLAGEPDKTGVSWDELPELAAAAARAANLHWAGLMGMAAEEAGEAAGRACFARLRESRDELARRHGVALPELSMGMSGDFAWAIAEGATMVRVGGAIFGQRVYD